MLKNNIKQLTNRLAKWVYLKTLDEYSITKPIPIAKVWSRKGNCPICFTGCGSKHKVGCIYKK